MPQIETKYFGTLPYAEDSTFEFPFGLPGFENEKQFVLIELEQHAPLLFLQSSSQKNLCFLAFPILVADRDYRLRVTPDDLRALDLNPTQQPELGREVLVLALLSLHDGISATANLMAPIVVNLNTHRSLQAIRPDSIYSHRHPIRPRATGGAC